MSAVTRSSASDAAASVAPVLVSSEKRASRRGSKVLALVVRPSVKRRNSLTPASTPRSRIAVANAAGVTAPRPRNSARPRENSVPASASDIGRAQRGVQISASTAPCFACRLAAHRLRDKGERADGTRASAEPSRAPPAKNSEAFTSEHHRPRRELPLHERATARCCRSC